MNPVTNNIVSNTQSSKKKSKSGSLQNKLRGASILTSNKVTSVSTHEFEKKKEVTTSAPKVTEGGSKVIEMSDEKFKDEFRKVENEKYPNLTFQVAEKNRSKSRYGNILPSDQTLVECPDFINASMIFDPTGAGVINSKYIATQGPLGYEQWNLLQSGSRIFVTLCRAEEKEGNRMVDKCFPFWDLPKDVLKINKDGVLKLLKTEEISIGTQNKTSLFKRTYEYEYLMYGKKENVKETVIHFQYMEWADHGIPELDNFLEMIAIVEDANRKIDVPFLGNYRKTDVPLVVNCSAGIGRSGVFIGVASNIKKMKAQCAKGKAINFDLKKTTIQMRGSRPGMIQTEEQYIFAYKALEKNRKDLAEVRPEVLVENLCKEINDSSLVTVKSRESVKNRTLAPSVSVLRDEKGAVELVFPGKKDESKTSIESTLKANPYLPEKELDTNGPCREVNLGSRKLKIDEEVRCLVYTNEKDEVLADCLGAFETYSIKNCVQFKDGSLLVNVTYEKNSDSNSNSDLSRLYILKKRSEKDEYLSEDQILVFSESQTGISHIRLFNDAKSFVAIVDDKLFYWKDETESFFQTNTDVICEDVIPTPEGLMAIFYHGNHREVLMLEPKNNNKKVLRTESQPESSPLLPPIEEELDSPNNEELDSLIKACQSKLKFALTKNPELNERLKKDEKPWVWNDEKVQELISKAKKPRDGGKISFDWTKPLENPSPSHVWIDVNNEPKLAPYRYEHIDNTADDKKETRYKGYGSIIRATINTVDKSVTKWKRVESEMLLLFLSAIKSKAETVVFPLDWTQKLGYVDALKNLKSLSYLVKDYFKEIKICFDSKNKNFNLLRDEFNK